MLGFLRHSEIIGRLAQLVEHLVYTDKANAILRICGPTARERSVILW